MSGASLHDPESPRSASAGGAERDIPARAVSAIMAAVIRRIAEHLERPK